MEYFVKPSLPEKDVWIFAHIMTTDGKEYFLGTDKDSLTGDVKEIKVERGLYLCPDLKGKDELPHFGRSDLN